ncbi:hypothetical protein [Salinicola halophilus]|uniref:hypothetical protein n=1 Tax=Salinicola halophilus TaxID=184065 RepID=UPI000DA22B42|nr:hypothetical protein [Salinicola halophilus]
MYPEGLFVLTSASQSQTPNRLLGSVFYRESVILGNDGLAEYLHHHPEADVREFSEGRFILVRNVRGKVTVKTDDLAQDTVYYFSDTSRSAPYWVISNSMLALARQLRYDGFSPSFHEAATLGFFAGNQSLWGGQPLSSNMLIDGVRFIPAGRYLEIEPGGLPRVVRSPSRGASGEGYAEGLVNYVRDIQGRVKALTEQGYRFNLGLSGGIDSRMNFALMRPFLQPERVRVHSNQNRSEDYEVVRQIQQHFDFPIDGFASRQGRNSGQDNVMTWMSGVLGAYLPLRMPMRDRNISHTFNVHGGNFRAGIYHIQPLEKRAKNLARHFPSKDKAALVEREFYGFFDSIDVDVQDPIALDHHYINTRARFHYGLNWYRQLDQPLFTPHLSRRLFDLYHRLTPQEQEGEKLIFDVLSLTDPSLINFPFDSPQKGFSQAVREQRSPLSPRDLAAVDLPDFRVYGTLARAEPGEDHPDAETEFLAMVDEKVVQHATRLKDSGPMLDAAIEEVEKHARLSGTRASHRYAALIVTLGEFANILGKSPRL